MPEAARTLVKSPPELWAELSDPSALTRHLGAFGDIRITRLDPESTVAWEGDRASGTVDLEPAGWGTKVTVRADDEAAPEPEEPEPPAVAIAAPAEPQRGFLARLFRRRPPAVEAIPEPEPEPAPRRAPERGTVDTTAVLDDMLARLGSARHRPFSR